MSLGLCLIESLNKVPTKSMRVGSRWALFLSGRGSNAQAVMDLQGWGDIALVLSNSQHFQGEPLGVTRARRAGIPVFKVGKKIDWNQVDLELRQRSINKIFLLGFMRLLPAEFVNKWAGKIFNLHPSLLPAYPGLEAIEKSFQEGAAMGVTVHVVVPEMDAGPILFQRKVLSEAPTGRHSLTLDEVRFLISTAEQALVRETFLKDICLSGLLSARPKVGR